ncbi:MAG: 30S ribosomal protein S20 [Clostridia bacterium]|jgi:small subunit ribosomal protein S20|nr:30S ribosomal protein S20 [Oscillospiraceae bacterium]MBQ1954170.1 30S ribosomal protein S20 [Clostridia bacterium]
MPNIKSAKKRVLVNSVKNLQNRMIKSSLKTALKKFDLAIAENDKAKASAEMGAAIKAIDKAAAKGVIHKNNAAHKKSSVARKFNAMA